MVEGALTTAFLLHQKPYRETSAIVDLLCEDDHYLQAVCKGVRGKSVTAARLRSALQPFVSLGVEVSGRSELKNLYKTEALAAPFLLSGKALYSAMYVNELVVRISRYEGVAPGIFNYYKQVIERLADISSDTARGGLSAKPNNEAGRVNGLIEFALREFELSYLRLLGYGIDLLHCAGDGQKIKSGFFYRLDPQQGFLRIETSSSNSAMKASLECIPGHVLLAIAAGTYHDKQALLFAKLICREFFKPMLADKPLRSRELFV